MIKKSLIVGIYVFSLMCTKSQTMEAPQSNTSWLLKVENTSHFHQTFSDNWCNLDNINSSIGYKVYDWLQVGIQIGGAINEIPDYSDAIYVDGFYHNVPLRKKFIPNIGVQYSIHLLPILFKEANLRVDTYIRGDFSLLYGFEFNLNEEPGREVGNRNSHGFGLAYYPWKKVGVHIEYNPLHSYLNYNSFTYGITYRF